MNVHKYSMSHNQSNVREIIKMLVILGPYSIQNNVVSRWTRNTNLSPLQLHNEVSQTKKLSVYKNLLNILLMSYVSNISKYLWQEEVSITAWSKVLRICNGILINVVQRTFNKMMSALWKFALFFVDMRLSTLPLQKCFLIWEKNALKCVPGYSWKTTSRSKCEQTLI